MQAGRSLRLAPCGVLRTNLQQAKVAYRAFHPILRPPSVQLHAAAQRSSSSRAQQPSVAAAGHGQRGRTQPPSTGLVENVWTTLLGRLAKAAAVLALAAAITLSAACGPANAARSGGRMGGSAGFSGRSSYASSSFGSGMGSRSSLGSAFGGGSSLGRSTMFGSSWLGRSMRNSAPPAGTSITMTSISPLGFFSPFGMGYGYGGGGIVSLLFWGVFAVVMLQVVRGVLDRNGDGDRVLESGGERLTVAKVQVGLLGSARELQRDLERIAARADTTTPKGLHYVLQETVLSLMRNPDYCIYGFAKAGVERSADEAELRFNKLSMEERGKFEKETLVNVGGRSTRSTLGRRPGGAATVPITELIVVTILVASEGRVKLPRVTSRSELKEALAVLGSLRADDVLAVEVLWTPEAEDDYFTVDDLASDYPLLNTL